MDGGMGRGECVHGINVAHEHVAEQKVEVVWEAVQRCPKRVDADRVLVVFVDDPHRGTQFHRVNRVRVAPIPHPNGVVIMIMGQGDRDGRTRQDVRKREREIDLSQTGNEPRVLVGRLDVHRSVELAIDRIDGVARDIRQTGPAVDERNRLALFRSLDGRREGKPFPVDSHGVHRDRPTGRRRRCDRDLGRVRDVAEFGIVFADGEVSACGVLAIFGPLQRETE